jgi:ABC-2 type transport system ATP-binding protein
MTAAASDLAIDLRHVAKTYRGKVMALRGIDMQVHRGEVFGLLGPNGAGKSTLVKIMMTVIRPTRADGTVLGKPVGHKPTLARVGYLPENHRFPRYLTGRQTLHFFGALAGMPRAARHRRSAELLDVVGMAEWADRPVGTYSKGMMQRVGLAQALANDPDLVLLDEPTDGVDPMGRKEIRDVLSAVRAQGKTVFINSHMLSELEMICDRVAILLGGMVVKQGTMDDLAAAKQRYEVEFVATNGATTSPKEVIGCALNGQFTHVTQIPVLGGQRGAAAAATPPADAAHGRTLNYAQGSQAPIPHPTVIEHGKLPSGQWLELQGNVLRIGTTDPIEAQPMLDALRGAGMIIRRFQQVRPSLEDLFIDAISAQQAESRPGARLK